MTDKYDVIIIGSGPGGMAVGGKLAAAKKKVLVVEKDRFGGTCPNRGCDPKKMIYSVIHTYYQAKKYQENGLKGDLSLSWPELLAFKESYTNDVDEKMKAGLESQGMETVRGGASFIDEQTIQVGEKTYRADKIVLATGGYPRILDIPGKEYLSTSDDFLEMKALPKKVGFIGTGFIAMEFINVLAAFGVEMEVFQMDDKILGPFPQSAAKDLIKLYEQRGVHFHWNTEVKEVKKDEELLVTTKDGKEYHVEMLISAIGREVNLKELKLDKLGLETNRHGIVVNEYLQTKLPHIFAIGDCVAHRRPDLTPVAEFEGDYVGDYILGKEQPITYPVVPSVVFTSPQLAQTGVTEKEALENLEKYERTEMPLGSWFNYLVLKDQEAKVTMITEKETGLLKGAYLLSSEAEGPINFFTHLINTGVKSAEIKKEIFLYPTLASDFKYMY